MFCLSCRQIIHRLCRSSSFYLSILYLGISILNRPIYYTRVPFEHQIREKNTFISSAINGVIDDAINRDGYMNQNHQFHFFGCRKKSHQNKINLFDNDVDNNNNDVLVLFIFFLCSSSFISTRIEWIWIFCSRWHSFVLNDSV